MKNTLLTDFYREFCTTGSVQGSSRLLSGSNELLQTQGSDADHEFKRTASKINAVLRLTDGCKAKVVDEAGNMKSFQCMKRGCMDVGAELASHVEHCAFAESSPCLLHKVILCSDAPEEELPGAREQRKQRVPDPEPEPAALRGGLPPPVRFYRSRGRVMPADQKRQALVLTCSNNFTKTVRNISLGLQLAELKPPACEMGFLRTCSLARGSERYLGCGRQDERQRRGRGPARACAEDESSHLV